MAAGAFEDIPSKIFIGGLASHTSNESLRSHFEKYGDVEDSILMMDRVTGRSRGFGFITFRDTESVDRVMAEAQVVDGKGVEVKRAVPRDPSTDSNNNTRKEGGSQRTKKIFVGGIAASTTEEEFKNYFEKYGTVVDAVLMYDKDTNRPRGFGFITFDTEDAVEEVMLVADHTISGKWVEIKRAVPKTHGPPSRDRGGGGGGGGRDRGGYGGDYGDSYGAAGPYGAYGAYPYPRAAYPDRGGYPPMARGGGYGAGGGGGYPSEGRGGDDDHSPTGSSGGGGSYGDYARAYAYPYRAGAMPGYGAPAGYPRYPSSYSAAAAAYYSAAAAAAAAASGNASPGSPSSESRQPSSDNRLSLASALMMASAYPGSYYGMAPSAAGGYPPTGSGYPSPGSGYPTGYGPSGATGGAGAGGGGGGYGPTRSNGRGERAYKPY